MTATGRVWTLSMMAPCEWILANRNSAHHRYTRSRLTRVETPTVKFVHIEPMLSDKETKDAKRLFERACKARLGELPQQTLFEDRAKDKDAEQDNDERAEAGSDDEQDSDAATQAGD